MMNKELEVDIGILRLNLLKLTASFICTREKSVSIKRLLRSLKKLLPQKWGPSYKGKSKNS